MGEKAANLLIDRLENDYGEENYETQVITSELIERESTK